MVTDLTGLDIANASLLDEATAAAEAVNQCWNAHKKKKNTFYVSNLVHPQNIDVMKTRAEAVGVNIVVGDLNSFDYSKGDVCGVMIQYPATDGTVADYTSYIQKVSTTLPQKTKDLRSTNLAPWFVWLPTYLP
jgi:glycine dehydrogenase